MLKYIWVRRIIAVLLPVGLLCGIIILYLFGSRIPCITYQLTGLYCPGCGMGRAAEDLLHLQIGAAFSHNLPGVLCLPFVVYYCLYAYLRYFWNKNIPIFHVGKAGTIVTLAVVIVFTVCRNIPAEPFLFLAP